MLPLHLRQIDDQSYQMILLLLTKIVGFLSQAANIRNAAVNKNL